MLQRYAKLLVSQSFRKALSGQMRTKADKSGQMRTEADKCGQRVKKLPYLCTVIRKTREHKHKINTLEKSLLVREGHRENYDSVCKST